MIIISVFSCHRQEDVPDWNIKNYMKATVPQMKQWLYWQDHSRVRTCAAKQRSLEKAQDEIDNC